MDNLYQIRVGSFFMQIALVRVLLPVVSIFAILFGIFLLLRSHGN